MKSPARVALAGFLALALAGSPVLACCDDFWSCAGAVASGGLTCVVEAAVNALKAALDSTKKTRDDAAHDFDQALKASVDDTKATLDTWKKHATDAADDAARSADAASKLAGDENARLKNLTASGLRTLGGAAAAPTAKPSGASRLVQAASTVPHASAEALLKDDSLESMKRQVDGERKAAEAAKAKALQAAEAAAALAAASAKRTSDAFEVSFLTGIGQLIVLLEDGISNPVKAVATVGAAIQILAGLESALSNEWKTTFQREADTRASLADAPHPPADVAEGHAKRAREILEKMRRAATLQEVARRHDLAMSVLAAPTPGPAGRPRLALASAAALSTFARSLPLRAASLRATLSRVKPAGPPDVAPYRGKVTADLASQFKGKAGPAAEATRNALLAEARRRFASDPKTLAGVEKLIADASKVR
jgi:hypothetical protein